MMNQDSGGTDAPNSAGNQDSAGTDRADSAQVEPGQRKRPRTTSTQPLSLHEGHLAPDSWWNQYNVVMIMLSSFDGIII